MVWRLPCTSGYQPHCGQTGTHRHLRAFRLWKINLDPEMIKEVLDVMIDLAQEGMTMIVVSHEMGFARSVAHKVLFMDFGKIVEENTPQEFFENPQHERTKLFLSQILH